MEHHLPIKIQLPDNFLEEEVRCDFIVTQERKKLWAVLIDMFCELLRVCEKHSIRLFLDGGSILGAVRHQGFIPWDDDMDVMVSRHDYMKLCKIAPKEFKHPYFFQTELTDHGSMRGHAQLRNSETTGILQSEYTQRKTFNQGIFLDIFPYDYLPDNANEAERFVNESFRLRKKIREKQALIVYLQQKRRNVFAMCFNYVRSLFYLGPFYSIFGVGLDYKRYENYLVNHSKIKTHFVTNISMGIFKKNWVWPSYHYDDIIWMPFEFVQVPIPHKYEERLDIQYGNWHEFVKSACLHGGLIYDTGRCYKEFLRNEKL